MNNLTTSRFYPSYPTTAVNTNQYYTDQRYLQPNNWYGQNFSNVPSQNTEMNTNIQWVEGQNAAESYILPNGVQSFALWDARNPIIYVKSFDSNGKPFTKRLQYVDLDAPPETEEVSENVNYITKEQFDKLSEQLNTQISELTKKLNDFKSKIGNMNNSKKVSK